MKKANAVGSIKMFADTASDSQLEQLRTVDPVLFRERSGKTWLMAVRDLQPHESIRRWEAIAFQRALIDAALLRVSLKRCDRKRGLAGK